MVVTALVGALILASTPPKPAPPPPPPPPRPQSGGSHVKVFDGGGALDKPGVPPAPAGGLAPAPKPATPLLPAIQKARESAASHPK